MTGGTGEWPQRGGLAGGRTRDVMTDRTVFPSVRHRAARWSGRMVGMRERTWVVTSCSLVVVVSATIALNKLALVAALGLLAGLLVLRRPIAGVAVLIPLVAMNDVISRLIGSGTTALAFGALKDALLFLLLLAAWMSRTQRVSPIVIGSLVALQLLVIPAAFLATSAPGALYGWRNDFAPALLVYAVATLVTPQQSKWLMSLFVSVAQASSIVAILTWRQGVPWLVRLGVLPPEDPDIFPYQFFSVGNSTPRAFSPYGHPNGLGVVMALAVAVIWCREDWSRRRRVILLLLPITACVLSRSRSGMLGVAFVLVFLVARHLRASRFGAAPGLLTMVGLLGAAAVLVIVAQERYDSSVVGHAESVQSSLGRLLKRPLGYGLGNVGPRARRFTDDPILTESFILLVGLSAGVFALVAYILLYGTVWHQATRQASAFTLVAPAAIVASAVSQLVLPTMQDGSVSYAIWIVVGLGLVHAPRLPTTSRCDRIGVARK